MSAVGLGFG